MPLASWAFSSEVSAHQACFGCGSPHQSETLITIERNHSGICWTTPLPLGEGVGEGETVRGGESVGDASLLGPPVGEFGGLVAPPHAATTVAIATAVHSDSASRGLRNGHRRCRCSHAVRSMLAS